MKIKLRIPLITLCLPIMLSSFSFSIAGETHSQIAQSESQLLGGKVVAMCYSGFRKGQHPDRGQGAVNPSEAETIEDLEILTRDGNFTLLRVYDSQENTEMVLRLIKEHGFDCQILLGAWLDAEVNNPNCPWLEVPYTDEKLAANKIANKEELDRAIRLANEYPEIIVAVAVGNEALVDWNDHMVPVEQVIEYVHYVKDAIEQPVTVADNYEWWAKDGKELAAELDFISVHVYPVWEGKSIEEGLSYSIENVQRVRNALPESTIVLTEVGWATTASEFGERASEEAQLRYYNEFFDWAKDVNITTFFFEAFDESWKGNPDNPIGAEKHWGIFFEDRTPKKVMHELYPDLIP
jgi:exo-beta-1,3-glucanase (GH17 family)